MSATRAQRLPFFAHFACQASGTVEVVADGSDCRGDTRTQRIEHLFPNAGAFAAFSHLVTESRENGRIRASRAAVLLISQTVLVVVAIKRVRAVGTRDCLAVAQNVVAIAGSATESALAQIVSAANNNTTLCDPALVLQKD